MGRLPCARIAGGTIFVVHGSVYVSFAARIPWLAGRLHLPSRGVWMIGLIGFCALFVKASCGDWCAVYLKRILQAGPGLAATAFSAFAFAVASARLGGDFVVRRFGRVATVRVLAGLGTVGGVPIVVASGPALTIAGFAMVGLGIAVVFPMTVAAAGHSDVHRARAIAGVATMSYGAGLAAPGLVGGTAEASSVRASFVLVTSMVVLVALGDGALRAGRSDMSLRAGSGCRRRSNNVPLSTVENSFPLPRAHHFQRFGYEPGLADIGRHDEGGLSPVASQ